MNPNTLNIRSFTTRSPVTRLVSFLVLSFALMTGVAHAMDSRSGNFKGLNNHTVTGTATIVKTDSGYQIQLSEDFTFDGAPDPKIALGTDGSYDHSTIIRLLDSNTGAQTYDVPASIDVSKYNEVHIWCEKFAVGLAVAPVN